MKIVSAQQAKSTFPHNKPRTLTTGWNAAIALATKRINKYAGTIPVILARH